MKKRVLVVVLLLIAAFFAWWLWPRLRSNAPLSEKPGSSTNQEVAPNKETAVGASTVPATSASTVAATKPAAAKPSKEEQLRDVMNSANRPISFYGKVIDQDGNPIPDVKVTFKIRYTKEVLGGGIGDTFAEPSVTTGIDGKFALTGAKGALLGFTSFEKAGYEPSETGLRQSYWYWRDKDPYQPDPDRPEIFHMWKKAGAEKLVRKGIGQPLPCDGTPVLFDLLSGTRVASGGDIKVTLERNPRQITYGQRNYEWSVTIEPINGGIIKSTDEQMYLAPVDGYENKITVHMAADAPRWTDMQDVAAYLKLRGGKYYGRASFELSVGSDRASTPFSITVFVNPTGSRNLEYDPAQDLAPAAHPQSAASSPKP
jgi:hypothetical protein